MYYWEMIQLPRTPEPGAVVYANVDEFLGSAPAPGVHAISLGGQWLDVQYVDRGSRTTMVGFHSALIPTSTLPMFSGGNLAADAGMNFIGVSDPSLQMGGIHLAWYLGNSEIGPLRPILSPVISHLLAGSHPVLFGASGGGYAAVLYGRDFPGCTVVAANPRLNMIRKPKPIVERYAKVCHAAEGRWAIDSMRSKFVVEDLGEFYAGGLPFDLVLLQNQEDEDFRDGQAEPFLERLGHDPRLTYVRLQNGPGHVAVPRPTLLEALRQAAATPVSSLRG